jgi:diguanylate cyclase (GGDEF)-like protein
MSSEEVPGDAVPSWSPDSPPDKSAGRYVLGLGLIAVMMVVSTVLVARELGNQAEEVRILNVASDLPGLTYEIRSAVSELATNDAPDALTSLEASLGTFSQAYIGLQFGDPALGIAGAPSAEVDRLLGLADPLFNQVINIARSALDAAPTRSDAALLELSSSAFRSRMEAVVFQYQREAETRVQSLARLEFGLLSVGLLLLLAEAMFLFRPAVRADRRRWQEVTVRHADQRRRDRAELDYLAQFDQLTGLPNRMLFRDRLDQAIKRARRSGGWASVLFVDLDNFSVVNDQLGHEVGDELLRRAAQRVSETVRAADTVAHLGGDEFAIVVEGTDDTTAAESVAEKAVTSLNEPYRIDGRDIQVSASIGVAVFPVDGEDADALLRDSALAMYAAKDMGRNGVQFYTTELRRRTSERIELLASLRTAIDTPGQLSLWYQPKLEIATGRLTGVEALVRWHHPQHGLIMPDRFIPIAEETGLIIPLDRWVLQEACRQLRVWTDDGMDDFVLSVNVSSRQFHQGELTSEVQEALLASDVEPNRLEVEVTEGTLIDDIEPARVTLDRLRDLGVRISIDDFGTGYSSLSYLKRLPIDVLKIDRSFIHALPDDLDDAAISEAIVSLGHTLKMEIVAEGVETQDQFDFLGELGCDTAQGYLIAAPLPEAQFAEFVTGARLRAG